MSSRNNKYRLQIFKQLKRGNYIITPYNVYKNITFSSKFYLDQYKFLSDITVIKNYAPLNCNDFYSNGYDCNLISNGEAILINWIYGQSKVQNKGVYSIVLTKTLSGICNCLFLDKSNELKTSKNKPFLFNISSGKYLNRNEYPLGKIPLESIIYSKPTNLQTIDPHILYSYVNHNFYSTNIDENNHNSSVYIDSKTVRNLYESCSILNIRQDIFGNGVKRGTFILHDYALSGRYTGSITFKDDTYSNLYVNTINTESFVHENNLLLHLSFDEKFKHRIENKRTTENIRDYSLYKNDAISNSGSKYAFGFLTTGLKQEPVGTSLNCDGNSVYVPHKNYLEFNEDDNFSIAFFISASAVSQNTGSQYSYIIAKQEYSENFIKNEFNRTIDYKYLNSLSGVYPFSIKYINSGSDAGKIYFSRYGGTNEAFITSSMPLTESFYHVVCQKSGSIFQLYVNGQLNSSGSCTVNGSVYNTSPIFIGSLFETKSAFYGNLDEIRIYNKPLTNEEISSLSNTDYINTQALQTNKVGNVFYNTGVIVISTPLPAYTSALLGSSGSLLYEDISGSYYGFEGTFQSTKKIFQHEIIIPIRNYEFNFSSNPTLKKNNRANSIEFKPFVSSSDFNVYFTSIGLYNRNYELVAIAKLSTPIPKYQDKDLNIIVKFDVE